jgi:hypothetical protein
MGKIAGAQIREGKIEKRERERYIFYADEPRLDGCSFSLSLSLSLSSSHSSMPGYHCDFLKAVK